MKRTGTIELASAVVVMVSAMMVCPGAKAATNLVPDASFESRLPAWFSEKGGVSYYAAKEEVTGAPDGKYVLAIQGWDKAGSVIPSPVFELQSKTYTGAISIRSFGKVENASVELALFDEKGVKKLGSFGTAPVDGKGEWRRITGTARLAEAVPAKGRLAIVVRGPQAGARVEADLAGLFEGNALGAITDNNDTTYFEAKELANGKGWVKEKHYDGWYSGFPFGGEMLSGVPGIREDENKPVTRTLAVRTAGKHRVWVRFVTYPAYHESFTVAVTQNGKMLGSRELFSDDKKYEGNEWVWESFDIDAAAGAAQLVLTRPSKGAVWTTRKINFFIFTDRLDYQPEIADFETPAYLRFVNTSEGLEPFCLFIFVRRHGPPYYAVPGILSCAGLSGSYYVPAEPDKWLAAGQSSPWVRMDDYVLLAGGRNNVSLTATRKGHTAGFVAGRIRGRLEFAAGPERKVVKTIAVDQEAPNMRLTLPGDIAAHPEEIRTALDYIKETEDVVAKIGPVAGKPAKNLDLTTSMGLQPGYDDPEAIRREIGIIKSLGFNNTYWSVAPPDKELEFCRENGLTSRLGLANYDLWGCYAKAGVFLPDREKMDRLMQSFATTNAPILDHVVRLKVMDEPGGPSYESIGKLEPYKEEFIRYLQGAGITPADLKVKDWSEAVPVGPENSREKPALFYHTSMFRLECMANMARAVVEAKNKYMPKSARAYVNYSPPSSGGSWTIHGNDPFLVQRNGGLEMGWTEDWLGWGLGPQHMSDTLALLRSAGRPDNEPVGAYCVGSDSSSPVLMRMKYYTLAAGGVRSVETYDYGPWYAGIDSWGRNFDIYPAIRAVQFELGGIDEALDGTVRRKSDIAILYNRAAYIWEKGNYGLEQNGWYTHWALAHGGYDADFIPEEDVESGRLSNYKVLYMDGLNMRRKTAQAIAEWVEKGGVAFGAAGSGARDEYDAPMDVLEKVFGARSEGYEYVANVGRPKHELPGLKALGQLAAAPGADAPRVSFGQFCIREKLVPAGAAKVILKNEAGVPEASVNRYGRGTAIRVAALPGISYVHDAAKPPYKIETYLPKNFRPEMKEFLVWPAKLAGAYRVAETSAPVAEIVRYDGPDRAVVFVIDHNAEPVNPFEFTLFDAGNFGRARSASGAPVSLKSAGGGAVRVSLPMNAADAVVLER